MKIPSEYIPDMDQLKDIPVFFIVGRPRSGTTLLRTLLDSHTNTIVPPECQFIINLYPRYGKITHWNSKTLEKFYNELVRQWLFDLWPVDKEKLHKQLLSCTGEYSYGTICKVVYSSYQSIFPHDQILSIGDKNPGYTIYTPKLLKIFPEARFIHIIRDYRDNFLSIRNVDFELPYISLTVSKWKLFIKKFRKAAFRHPGTHMEVRYEDLAHEPEKEFEKICHFLAIPYSASPLDFYQRKEEAMKIYPKEIMEKYQSSLFNKVNTSRIGLWESSLSATEIKVADAVAGKYAEMAGYRKKYAHPSIGIRIRSLPGVILAHSLALATDIIDLFPYKLREAILIKAPWQMGRLYLRLFKRDKLQEVSLAKK